MGAFCPNRKSKVKVTNYVWSWQQIKRLRASGNQQQWLMGAPTLPTHTHTAGLLGAVKSSPFPSEKGEDRAREEEGRDPT